MAVTNVATPHEGLSFQSAEMTFQMCYWRRGEGAAFYWRVVVYVYSIGLIDSLVCKHYLGRDGML